MPWAGWAADLPADVDLGIPYQKEALANSLRCLETIRGDEYRKALENVLDNYLNYYIVDNVAEAAHAIQLLDTNKKGKANFFVLNQFKSEGNGLRV